MILVRRDNVEKSLKKMSGKLNRLLYFESSCFPIEYNDDDQLYNCKQYSKVSIASILSLIAAISDFVLPIDV